jgi:hypothetical protein
MSAVEVYQEDGKRLKRILRLFQVVLRPVSEDRLLYAFRKQNQAEDLISTRTFEINPLHDAQDDFESCLLFSGNCSPASLQLREGQGHDAKRLAR